MDQQVTIDGVEFVAIRAEGVCSTAKVTCWFIERKDIGPESKCPRISNTRKLLCIYPTYETIFMKPEDFLKARMRGDV